MNFKIIDDNTFIVKIISDYIDFDEDNIYDKIKKVLINIRKRYAYDIYGFYDVEMSSSKGFITILKFIKKDDDELFRNTIDLKVKKDIKPVYIGFNDYFLIKEYPNIIKKNNKYVVNSNLIERKDMLKLCEHYSI